MSTLRVEIRMGGAAFEDDPQEAARILRAVAWRLEQGETGPCHAHSLMDSNGNRCGQWKVTGR